MVDFDQLIEDLPSKEIFPEDMPRYPNLWFYLDERFLLRPHYRYAVPFLASVLERYIGLEDSFVLPDSRNPHIIRSLSQPGEGADFQARVGPLQYYRDPKGIASHWHQVHARFYTQPLYNRNLDQAIMTSQENRITFFRIPSTVHYEVATEEALHPYVDSCPVCGITDEYDVPIDKKSEDYCIKIHDPLGLEFIMNGTVRGKSIVGTDGAKVRSLRDLERHFSCNWVMRETIWEDPLLIGLIVLSPYGVN